MKSFIGKIFIFLFFILISVSAYAAEPVKINGLVFDNSDKLIYINLTGTIDENVTFSKGYLKEPDRIYLDINNTILTTPKKNYNAKYSDFNNIKISQFTLDPKTVRIVFEYNEKLDLSAFKVYKNKDSVFIKTKRTLVNSPKLKTVYSNSKADKRITFFEGAVYEDAVSSVLSADEVTVNTGNSDNEILKELQTGSSQKDYKINSKYYIDSVTETKNGILINGIGKLNLIPSFALDEPSRLIVDIDDAVLAKDLRNKTFATGKIQTTENSGEIGLNSRDTLKLGQNNQSIVRLVIRGEGAKNYRGIISPDSKSLYLTNKSNIIETKMSDINANLVKSHHSKFKNLDVTEFNFDDSAAFNVFEENSNLYIDINNVNLFDDAVLEPVYKGISNFKTVRIASDKLRLIIPYDKESDMLAVKTTPDNDCIKIYVKKDATSSLKEKEKPKIVLVPSSIIAGKKPSQISNLFTVVIDAGHGGSDVGATRNNIYEKDITLKIAKLVEKKLNQKNVKTYMVREKDKTVSLAERCDFSNEKKPDIFVSIHVNSSTNENIKGIETHWYKSDSLNYANCVHKEMQKKIKKWNTNDRGLFNSKFYVINHTEAPAILCEIGFISNKEERDEITKAERQEETAEAIADGIYNYLKAKK